MCTGDAVSINPTLRGSLLTSPLSMFHQLLFIHLFRPFLKYKQTASPLPAHVSPRKFCTHAATTISKLLRIYKRTYGLRQIVNLAVYIAHTACTIHLLNLPEKNAGRDLIHGLKHLEEIAEGWPCARKTLRILSIVAQKWRIELPEEAGKLLERTDVKFAAFSPVDQMSPKQEASSANNHHHTAGIPPLGGVEQKMNHGQSSDGSYDGPSAIRSSRMDVQAHSAMTLPPQSASEADSKPRSQHYVLPQAQQEMWNRDRAARGVSVQNQTSPSVLFGGVDSLIEDSQEYWLQRDTGNLFAIWNGSEQDGHVGNGLNGNGYHA